MAQDDLIRAPLTDEDLLAGRDYLKSLRRLGFEPDFLGWGYEFDGAWEGSNVQMSEKRLVMVTSLIDRVGPSVIYDLLFKAYDASATPIEIDPFVVSIYSPESASGKAIMIATEEVYAEQVDWKVDRLPADADRDAMVIPPPIPFGGGVHVSPVTLIWKSVYTRKKTRFSEKQDVRRFERFKHSVLNLAA